MLDAFKKGPETAADHRTSIADCGLAGRARRAEHDADADPASWPRSWPGPASRSRRSRRRRARRTHASTRSRGGWPRRTHGPAELAALDSRIRALGQRRREGRRRDLEADRARTASCKNRSRPCRTWRRRRWRPATSLEALKQDQSPSTRSASSSARPRTGPRIRPIGPIRLKGELEQFRNTFRADLAEELRARDGRLARHPDRNERDAWRSSRTSKSAWARSPSSRS